MGELAGTNVTIDRADADEPQRLRYEPQVIQSVVLAPHEVQGRLLQRYQAARRVWRDNSDVQSAAALIGMSEREYCDRYIALFGPFQWVGSSANVPPPLDYDRAYREAKP